MSWDDNEIKHKLQEYFGYSTFRGRQEDIIKHVLSGKNTFVIMPTGAGKSLCYQLPAILMKGTTLVVSPLIALMKNQVDQMNVLGINAQVLNSTLTKAEILRVKSEILEGKVKLLYVAPETLSKEENILFLQNADISFIAIDEAHCISEWGHDFRPEYRRLKSVIDLINPSIAVVALTATATPKVQLDIQKNLNMEDAAVFKTSFNRTNLFYEVRVKGENAEKDFIRYIKQNPNKAGIVYCLSRKKVEELTDLLKVNGVNALAYHAGLDSGLRESNQDAFLSEDCNVVVATIAFGMGIDKPDVRFVIHYDAPKSMEGYYQETGRAGRDGLEGNCVLFYSKNDILKLEKFNKDKSVTERDNAKNLLMEMSSYAESQECRRKQILHYFGEYLEKDCGFCDNCNKPKEKFEGMEEVILALKVVVETEQRFTVNHLVDVLLGKMNEYVESYNHDDLSLFGEGDEKSEDYWQSLYKQILLQEFLEKDIDNYGVLKITNKGLDFLKKPFSVTLAKDNDELDNSDKEPITAGAAYDEDLFNQLKVLRKRLAKEMELPPYVLFQDPSLEEMATVYPVTDEDLARINGVGMGKVVRYGKPFIELIQKYVNENDIITSNDVMIKTAPNKSKLKIFIIQQIDRKIDLEEICVSKDIQPDYLITEIENICFSGTKLNLDYYINQIMDEDRQQIVYDHFMNAENDSIELAVKELGDEFSEEDIRLMRVKFISEVAN